MGKTNISTTLPTTSHMGCPGTEPGYEIITSSSHSPDSIVKLGLQKDITLIYCKVQVSVISHIFSNFCKKQVWQQHKGWSWYLVTLQKIKGSMYCLLIKNSNKEFLKSLLKNIFIITKENSYYSSDSVLIDMCFLFSVLFYLSHLPKISWTNISGFKNRCLIEQLFSSVIL
jgi:hypothetical protein